MSAGGSDLDLARMNVEKELVELVQAFPIQTSDINTHAGSPTEDVSMIFIIPLIQSVTTE